MSEIPNPIYYAKKHGLQVSCDKWGCVRFGERVIIMLDIIGSREKQGSFMVEWHEAVRKFNEDQSK